MKIIKQHFADIKLGIFDIILLVLSGILLFVFSVPHVMALRKILILSVFLLAFKSFLDAARIKKTQLSSLVWLAIAFQVWMLFIAGFIAEQPIESLLEWKGQWLPFLMCLVTGIGLARTIHKADLKNHQRAVAILICIPIVLFLGINAVVIIGNMVSAGDFLSNQLGITDEKGITNYLIALIEPILVADILTRASKGKKLLPIPNWGISIIFALAIFSLFAASSRNGLIAMILTFTLGGLLMLWEFRKQYSRLKITCLALGVLATIVGITLIAYKFDPRWQGFFETVPIAWDIDRDRLWVNHENDISKLPMTPSGSFVDGSQYYRIAWLHEGLRMLIDHPWGLEISRHTFRDLMQAKYGETNIFHSHNGWIDLGLNVGVLGLLLWISFLWALVTTGWKAWQLQRNPLGLALTLLTIVFVVRAILDSIFRNHVIEQFALVAGLLVTTIVYERKDESNTTSAS